MDNNTNPEQAAKLIRCAEPKNILQRQLGPRFWRQKLLLQALGWLTTLLVFFLSYSFSAPVDETVVGHLDRRCHVGLNYALNMEVPFALVLSTV